MKLGRFTLCTTHRPIAYSAPTGYSIRPELETPKYFCPSRFSQVCLHFPFLQNANLYRKREGKIWTHLRKSRRIEIVGGFCLSHFEWKADFCTVFFTRFFNIGEFLERKIRLLRNKKICEDMDLYPAKDTGAWHPRHTGLVYCLGPTAIGHSRIPQCE